MDTILQRPNRLGATPQQSEFHRDPYASKQYQYRTPQYQSVLTRPNFSDIPRDLGTLTSAGLNRPGSYPLGFNARPRLTPTPDLGRSWGPANGQGGMNLGTLTSEDLVRGGPDYNTYHLGGPKMTYEQFLQRNPNSPAATRSLSRPSYTPPQQTERANPLSGANNYPMEGTSVATPRPPFVQRGTLPMGQDAVPAPIKETESEDDDIARSMRGTFGRLRDVMGRRFSQPSASPALTLARAQIG